MMKRYNTNNLKKNQLHAVSRTQQGIYAVLRHSVPHFSPNSGDIECWVEELTAALFASTPERIIENINVNKYFISSSEDRTYNQ